MKIEIDQSGKLEDTSRHTFLAFSNGEHFVLKISGAEKRKLQVYFRKIGKPKLYIFLTFASLIIILLKKIKTRSNQIIIDIEYPGKAPLIKNFIKIYCPDFEIEDIDFHQIGKKSRAHYLAHGTAIKLLNPDLIVNAKDILKVIKKPGSA